MTKRDRRTAAAAGMRLAGAAAVCAALSLPLGAAAEPTACAPGQRVVFACSTGAKSVFVCASPDLAPSAGALQYRFGRPPAAELVHPPADADWRGVVRGDTLMFSGGGGAFLAFGRAPWRYVVYSAEGRGWRKAGVAVEKDGRRVASLVCKGEVRSELGPDLYERAGIPKANDGFDLP